MNLTDKTVLVMGATGALGSLIATALADAGATVLGTARTNDSAARLPASLSQSLLLDLEDATSVQTLVTYLAERPEPLDAIINAAGIVGFGTVESTTLADAARLMRVNHLAPAELISRLVPRLAE